MPLTYIARLGIVLGESGSVRGTMPPPPPLLAYVLNDKLTLPASPQVLIRAS